VLLPARLHAMDGGNSAKRVDGSGHADTRIFMSDYFISRVEVDVFKDDVTLRPGTRVRLVTTEQDMQPEQDVPTGGPDGDAPCTAKSDREISLEI
jgi:Kyakuja-Dileera-Zisupton transposase